MAVVWIASELQGENRLPYLLQAIERALELSSIAKVVVSIHTDNELTIEDPKVIIRKRFEKISQFAHLALLAAEESYPEDQWITFLDDDDLLLPEIERYYKERKETFIALQYISARKDDNASLIELSEEINNNNKLLLLSHLDNLLLRSDDFSGTSARFFLIKEYFSNRKVCKYIEPLEDTRFMRFLEENGATVADEPVAFHRILSSSSLWKQAMLENCSALIEKVEKLHLDIRENLEAKERYEKRLEDMKLKTEEATKENERLEKMLEDMKKEGK